MLCRLHSASSLLRGCSEEWLITSKWFDPDSDRSRSRLLFAASVLLDLHNCLQPTCAPAPEVLLNTSLRVQHPFPWYLLALSEHSSGFFRIKAAVCVLKVLEFPLSQRFSDFPTVLHTSDIQSKGFRSELLCRCMIGLLPFIPPVYFLPEAGCVPTSELRADH